MGKGKNGKSGGGARSTRNQKLERGGAVNGGITAVQLLVAAVVLTAGVLYVRHHTETEADRGAAAAADRGPVTREELEKAKAKVDALEAALKEVALKSAEGNDAPPSGETSGSTTRTADPATKPKNPSMVPPAGTHSPESNHTGLPEGWEIWLSQTGREYYVDHTTGTTTYVDPRKKNDVKARMEKAVWRSAMEGNVDLIQQAIALQPKVGFDLNAVTAGGLTALVFAAQKGHLEVAKLLLDAGVDVNVQDKQGSTALDWAVYHKHQPVVDVLLASGGGSGLKSEDSKEQEQV
jgi:hypothetical protein